MSLHMKMIGLWSSKTLSLRLGPFLFLKIIELPSTDGTLMFSLSFSSSLSVLAGAALWMQFLKNSATLSKPTPPATAPSTSSTIRQTGFCYSPSFVKCEFYCKAFFIAWIKSPADLVSLALRCLASYPHCFAKTRAIVVFPVPGGPYNVITFLLWCENSTSAV